MRVVLVLGGDPPDPRALRHLESADRIVATDGGAAALVRAGRYPDRIVGDMDSLPAALLAQAEAHGVALERHPEDKAETDGELALRSILAEDPKSLVLIGGHGGRSAMFLTHLRLLRQATEAGVDATMVGPRETLRVMGPGGRHETAPPALIDLIAMEPAVVDLTGLRYSGKDVALEPWTGRGVTNPVESDQAVVQVRSGVILVIEEHV